MERAGAFNFDMNEEFSPSLTKFQKPKEQNKNKRKKMMKPKRLPFEITHYNRAAINFIFILMFLLGIIINLDVGVLAAASI